MLIAHVDEINNQLILHHPYIIVCHTYNTIKINNLHNDVANEKGLGNFVLKIDSGTSSFNLIFLDCDTWHITNVSCDIFKKLAKKNLNQYLHK
jgi:hypothetical protein